MKTSQRLLALATVLLLSGSVFAQSTSTPTQPTTGTPTGGAGTGTTGSGGAAPTTGKPTERPTAGGTGTATTGGTTSGAPKAGKRPGPNENASDTAKAVHAIVEKFQAQREQYLAERLALVEKLRTATAAERKVIVEQLRADSESRADEERSLGKQIREELKKLREDRKSGG